MRITKDEILAEIKRTAAENGGSPLGVDRFSVETGIRVGDWHGRYWARWGDALQEAGFPPNTLKQPIPEDELLSKLAELVQELGRFPVRGELKLKRAADPTFPSHNAFTRRGGKSALADRLAAFAREQGLDDVVAICEPIATAAAPTREPKPAEDVLGAVYLLKSGRFYKIGRSNAVGRRARELAIQLPERAKLVHSISTDDPVGIEKYWHDRFADRRVRTDAEWFDLTAAEIAAFRRRKFM